jgi:cation diffusion facilitator CzcD-associated flavoprotein CzcO
MTIPAFEADGDLLALVPKAALNELHAALTDIKFVVVGKSASSTALVAELSSAWGRLSVVQRRSRRGYRSSDRHTRPLVSSPGADHLTASAALVSRLTRALTRAAGVAGDELVHHALERPSDMGAIIDLLRSTLPLLSAERELDPELETGVAALEAEDDLIRRAGGLKETKWVADYLAISPKSVAAKARRNELLSIARGDRNLYPAFQFRDGQVVPGVREILQALPLTNGWSRLSFLLIPDPGLDDRTPLDAFKTDRDAVLALAASADTQGAP